METKCECLSRFAYWERYIKSQKAMSYRVFLSEYAILRTDAKFVEEFGKYRARKLSPKQIEMLNKEFL